jgi:spore germination protein YaaH
MLAASGCAESGAGESRPLRFGAWVTYWDLDRGMDRLARQPSALEDVFFFVAELDAAGRPNLAVDDAAQEGALRQLRAGKAKAWLTVVNDTRAAKGKPPRLKDADAIHRMLADDAERAAHRRAIAELASRRGFAGVDVDYENLLPEDRDRFSAFVRELAADLAARDLRLSVTVQPKRQESKSVGPGAADWEKLCAAADRVQVMLYNLHSSKTGPGPLAERSWVGEVMGFGRSQCDPSRLVPVLKLGGMDWGPSGAKDLSHADATALLSAQGASLQRDGGGTPFFRYDGKDGPHTVYFEDAESIVTKVSWLEELGYERIVFWSLGREDPDILPRLARRSAPSSVSSVPPGGPDSLP